MPRYSELPDSGLYLEQTSLYINDILAPLEGISITSSMVSNYVKKGLIKNPIKKQYYAEHISRLFAITIIKQILPLEHIIQLFEMQQRVYPDSVAYDYFCSELENRLFYVYNLKDSIDDIGNQVSREKSILKNIIIAVSHMIYLNDIFQKEAENGK